MGLFKKKAIIEVSRKFCTAVIVAAGSSERMGEDKMQIQLGGIPILIRSAIALQKSDDVDEIIIVTKFENIADISKQCKEYDLTKVTKVLVGGENRSQSALAGVSESNPKAEIIAIHDGARPLVRPEMVDRVIETAGKFLAAAPGIPIKDTIKTVNADKQMSSGLDRDSFVAVQTPQAFEADLIKAALTDAVQKQLSLTDDCGAVELLNVKSRLCEGDEENIKITTPWDLLMAEAILASRGECL